MQYHKNSVREQRIQVWTDVHVKMIHWFAKATNHDA